MSEIPIGADVVEAAAKAWFEAGREREEREGLSAGLTWDEFKANEDREQEDFGWTLPQLLDQMREALDKLGLREDTLLVERVPVESISEGDRVIAASDCVLTVTATGSFAADVLLVELAHHQLRRKPGDFMFRVPSDWRQVDAEPAEDVRVDSEPSEPDA